jgi:hypothetical protein
MALTIHIRFAGRVIVAAILADSFGGFAALAAESRGPALGESVSIIQLVANPERYHGKVVFITAYATIELENNSLCMTPTPASHKDCIWLEYDDGTKAAWSKMNGHRVTVRGTFNKDNTGHFGGWSGALESVTEYWPD